MAGNEAAKLCHEGRQNLVADRNSAWPQHHSVNSKEGRAGVGPIAKYQPQCVDVPISRFGIVGSDVAAGVSRDYLDYQVRAQAYYLASPIILLMGLTTSEQEIGPESLTLKSVRVS